MLKPIRVFLGIGIFLLILAAIPLSDTIKIKASAYSVLKNPIVLFKNVSKLAVDLARFQQNAEQNSTLREILARKRFDDMQVEELRLENERLTKLLNLRSVIPLSVHHTYFARAILRSSLGWNRIVLIDKGARQGIRPNMLVLSESSLIGKVVEVGPFISKILLITDPKSRIGVFIQQTRQGGLLFGTASGKCHMKYMSIDTKITAGDKVETAGFGGFFPKGIPVGTVERAWKEPGQIYQVAEVKPFMELNRVEEVILID